MDVHGGRTDSAVLVPLFTDAAGDVHAVFTKRREDLERHAGEISFPGGRRDDGETLMETALREAHEEVGLPPEAVEIVGALAPVGTFVTNYRIYPFVGLIEPGFEWIAQETEVARGARVPPRRPRRRPLAQAPGPARDGVQDRRLRGRRPHGLGRDRADPGRFPVQDRSRSTAATASATHASPERVAAEDLERDLPGLGAVRGDRLARPLVDEAAHAACRRASPAASAAARRAIGIRIVPVSQQTIVTPCSASISVAIRSGSPT